MSDADVERLVAREAIRDLALRYALAVDGKDLDTLAALFVADVDNGRYGPGRDGVRRFYAQALRRFHCSVHLVANHVIDLDDNGAGDGAGQGPDATPDGTTDRGSATTATGVVYAVAQHHVLEPEHWFDETIAYFDTYERVADEADGRHWLFRRRRVRSWYRQYHGHPDHDGGRTVVAPEASGPKRGARMPEAFPTFEAFWDTTP